MKRFGAIAAVAVLLSVGSVGCVSLDEYNQLDRAHRTLKERYTALQQDWQDCQDMQVQKDVKIESLQNELAAKNETIDNLTQANARLQASLDNAEDILKRMAENPPTSVIVSKPLPAQLDNALKEFAAQHPDLVEYDSGKGAVRWKADLLFPLGSDSLANTGEVQEALKQFAEIVRSPAAEGFDVIVVGHTCTTPIVKAETKAKHPTNWHLSAHRAIAVMQMLASQEVSEKSMGVMGYGEYRPIGQDKARNRRVEIYLVPTGQVQNVSMDIYEVKDRGIAFLRPTTIAGDS